VCSVLIQRGGGNGPAKPRQPFKRCQLRQTKVWKMRVAFVKLRLSSLGGVFLLWYIPLVEQPRVLWGVHMRRLRLVQCGVETNK
jgi:hypothetical protein